VKVIYSFVKPAWHESALKLNYHWALMNK